MSIRMAVLISTSVLAMAPSNVASAGSGYSPLWCAANIKIDGAMWMVYSAPFHNANPPGNTFMYDAGAEQVHSNEWKKYLADKYNTGNDWIPHSCGNYVSSKPFPTESAALKAASDKRDEYKKHKERDGQLKYAGMVELDWVPAGAERMGAPAGDKHTSNPGLKEQ